MSPTPGGKTRIYRGDALRAYVALHEVGIQGPARALGFAWIEPEEEDSDKTNASSKGESPAEPKEAPQPPPAPDSREDPLEPIRFWRPVAKVARSEKEQEPNAEPPEAREQLTLEELRAKAPPPPGPPIVAGARLRRRLDAELTTPRASRSLDIPQLVDDLARGRALRELPRRRGLAHARLAIVLDPAQRLTGLWNDQLQVFAGWLHRLGAGRVRQLSASELLSGDGARSKPHLAPDEILVAVSDLGFYGSQADRKGWALLGRRLRAAGHHRLALVPCPAHRWEEGLARLWNAVDWSHPEGAGQVQPPEPLRGFPFEDPVEALFHLLAPALRLEPGLVRAVRRRLGRGADLGTEVELWNHPHVVHRSTGNLELDSSRRSDLIDQGLREGWRRDVVLDVARAVVDWHQVRVSLLWAAELIRYLGAGAEAAFDPAEIHLAQTLYARASRSAGPQKGAVGRPVVSFWSREVSRVPRAIREDPRFFESLRGGFHAWRAIAPDAPIPAWVTPDFLGKADSPLPVLRYSVRRKGQRLAVASAGTSSAGTWWIDLEAKDPRLWVSTGAGFAKPLDLTADIAQIELPEAEVLQLTTDQEQVTLETFERPEWATAAGRDGYGLWAAFEVEGVEQRMRWIPPGRFLMGSPEGEDGRWDDEGPQHPVELREGYWLAETPCTQELWEVVMGENPSRFRSPDRPVEQVSWSDCQVFLDRLNYRYPDLELALPSEAEWEAACRAGTQGATWLGDLEILGLRNAPGLGPIAWYGGNSGVGFDLEEGADSSEWSEKEHVHQVAGSRKVRKKDPNPWGLLDVLGNVFEWCWDFWGQYEAGLQIDPEGPEDGRDRVIRGGSWFDHARFVRAAYRHGYDPGLRDPDVGFRLSRGPWDRGAKDRGAVQSSRRGAPPERGGAVLDSSFEGDRGGAFRSRVRSRRIRGWVERLGWAVDGGLDEFGRWAALDVKGVIHRLRWIYPGRFWMGSPETEAGRYEDEDPRHEVTLTEGFWLGEVPCTQALWTAVTGENPSEFRSSNRPVEQVSWEDCQKFFERLEGLVPGFVGRLPTEAEWEYACRAGTEGATWLGDFEIRGERNAPQLGEIAWYGGNSGFGFDLAKGRDSSEWPEKQIPHAKAGTREVGLKPPNPWGLRDMLGNVLEWCEDAWNVEEPYPGGPRTNPVETDGGDRVIRGGSWGSLARYVRAACRFGYVPGFRYPDVGFRLSRGPQETGRAEPEEQQESRPAGRGTSRGVASKSGRRVR